MIRLCVFFAWMCGAWCADICDEPKAFLRELCALRGDGVVFCTGVRSARVVREFISEDELGWVTGYYEDGQDNFFPIFALQYIGLVRPKKHMVFFCFGAHALEESGAFVTRWSRSPSCLACDIGLSKLTLVFGGAFLPSGARASDDIRAIAVQSAMADDAKRHGINYPADFWRAVLAPVDIIQEGGQSSRALEGSVDVQKFAELKVTCKKT